MSGTHQVSGKLIQRENQYYVKSSKIDKDVLVPATMVRKAGLSVGAIITVKYTERRMSPHHSATSILPKGLPSQSSPARHPRAPAPSSPSSPPTRSGSSSMRSRSNGRRTPSTSPLAPRMAVSPKHPPERQPRSRLGSPALSPTHPPAQPPQPKPADPHPEVEVVAPQSDPPIAVDSASESESDVDAAARPEPRRLTSPSTHNLLDVSPAPSSASSLQPQSVPPTPRPPVASDVPEEVLRTLSDAVQLLKTKEQHGSTERADALLKAVSDLCEVHSAAARANRPPPLPVPAASASAASSHAEIASPATPHATPISPSDGHMGSDFKVSEVLSRLGSRRGGGGRSYDRTTIREILSVTSGDVSEAVRMVESGQGGGGGGSPVGGSSVPPEVATLRDALSVSEGEATQLLQRHGSIQKAMEAAFADAASPGSPQQPPPSALPRVASERVPPPSRTTPPARAASSAQLRGAWGGGPPGGPLPSAPPAPPARPSTVRHLFIVRHGERMDDPEVDLRREWDRPDKARAYDCPLTDKGKEQSQGVGKWINSVLRDNGPQSNMLDTVIITSPYQRCLETAVEIATQTGAMVNVMYSLGETYPKGKRVTWRGKPEFPSEISKSFPLVGDTTLPPFPEEIPEAHQRFVFAAESITESFGNHNVVMVSHGPCLDAMVVHFAGENKLSVVDLCGLLHLRNDKGPWELVGTRGVLIVQGAQNGR